MKQLGRIAATVLLCFSSGVLAKPQVTNRKPVTDELSTQSLLAELTGKDARKENDISLYAEMVSAYESDNKVLFKKRLEALLKRFPQSPYADNALFLAGRMAVDNKNYAEAIKYFARIEKDYPRSNKIVAAKFAKAMTYKKMNLPEFAMRTLQEVRNKYVGSPESFRADAELKMIK